MSDSQRELDIMEIERLVHATGLREHAEAWQRLRARLTTDRERVIEAVRDAYLCATSASDGVMLLEDYAVVADAAIKAMEETP